MAATPRENSPTGGKTIIPKAEEASRAKQAASTFFSRKTQEASRFGRILEDAGLVNEEMIKELVTQGNESAQSIKSSLIQTGQVREIDILDALAQQFNLERVDFEDVKFTPDLLEQLNPKIVKKYQIFPVRYTADTIWVALNDPLNIRTLDDLKMILNKEVIGCVAPEADITRAIRRFYEGDEITSIYEKAINEQDQGNAESARGFRDYQSIDVTSGKGEDQQENAVVRFVDLIFKQAVHERASDIHLEPSKHGLDIRFRVDGVLHMVPSPPRSWQNQIIARLKVMSAMDLAEKRVPQDGRIKISVDGKRLDLRVSSMPSYYGETIVMRILDQSSVLLGLEDVGFLPDNVQRFRKLIRSPNGVILMTGPTGSGKTTTLYAALSSMNNAETKIITAEDPVEYQIAGINQVQIDREVDLTFSMALRSMLRQSPDIILVGEIRDLETAEIAVRAALTGHLVFSTLHTNDAPSATTRLVDMGIKPYLVGSSLQAVIAQRLVRRICSNCKKDYRPNPGEIVEMGLDPLKAGDLVWYKGDGCDRCKAGYRGRTAIHEILEMDSQLRQMVIRQESATHLKKVAVEKGMRTLRFDGLEKMNLGQTTFEEIIRITQED